MDYNGFLTQVIDQGIFAANRDYSRPDQKKKRDGSVAGFQACRDKNPDELKELLETCAIAREDAHGNKDYWWFRCYEVEVEWVCNVVSAMLYNQGLPVIMTPTVRGMQQAAKILGVK